MFEDARKVQNHVKVAFFGDGGTGKTRAALSFPAPAVTDSERGSDPYRGKYDFKVHHANRWRELGPILEWIEKNPGAHGTLVIDSLTVFYQDLINDVVEYVRNKRGNEFLSQAEWVVIKRRWGAFLNRLVDLPIHVVLCMRERDEYEDATDKQGNEIRRKTGNHLMDADKQTKYVFDFVLRCYTEESKKKGESKFLIQVDKSRYDWLPKYSVHDVTGKRAFDALFASHIQGLATGEPLKAREGSKAGMEVVSEKPGGTESKIHPGAVAEMSTAESVGDIMEKFANPGDPDSPAATAEDIKVLMTRASQMKWPDGAGFTSADGKVLVRALYKVESSKELRKWQVDFLFEEFGKVLAGKAELKRDEKGIPFVASALVAAPASDF